MFEKFQEAVRNAYIDLKNNNLLDTPREIPSTGDLKKWCQQCLERGLTKEDEAIFQTFFNDGKSDKPLKEIVRKFEADKLRSLRNFINNDGIKRPDWDVVKLLAVLVDFKPRPYNLDDWNENTRIKKSAIDQEENNPVTKKDETLTVNENAQPEHASITPGVVIKEKGKDIENTSVFVAPSGNISTKKESTNPGDQDPTAPTIQTTDSHDGNARVDRTPLPEGSTYTDEFSTGTSTAVTIDKDHKIEPANGGSSGDSTRVDIKNNRKGSINFWNKKTSYAGAGVISFFIIIFLYSLMNKECMCWNGERYIEVDCKDNTRANEIIGLNRNKLDNFQKIMKPDTLNKEDIGRVWYSKIDNEVEFFTSPGHHPIQNHRSLKAATQHIINTYSKNKGLD